MNIGILLPLILIVGVMYMMSRSAKNKQRQAAEMRSKMEPGSGIRTIGGMYAVVKEVNEETVLLELTDGVHAHFAKNSIATVLDEDEFNRIVHGIEPEDPEGIDPAGDDEAGDDAEGGPADDGADTADTEDGSASGSADGTGSAADAKAGKSASSIDLGKSDAVPELGAAARDDAK